MSGAECSAYKELDSADRSVNQGVGYKCDQDLTPGWYRFTGAAGTQMATSCVPQLHCGTQATGWMNGARPSEDEGIVHRLVCYSYLENCCRWHSNIMVRNCGDYFVYKLVKPKECKLRYCGSHGDED